LCKGGTKHVGGNQTRQKFQQTIGAKESMCLFLGCTISLGGSRIRKTTQRDKVSSKGSTQRWADLRTEARKGVREGMRGADVEEKNDRA